MELSDIDEFIQDSDCKTKLFFMHKKRNKDNYELKAINPTIDDKLGNQLKKIVHKEIELHENLPKRPYNILGDATDTVEEVDKQKYANKLKDLLDAVNNPESINKINNKQYNFMIYNFSKDDENIFVIRRTKSFKKFAQGIAGIITGGSYKQLKNKNVIGTDDLIDILITEDEIYVFQHISFERVFDLRNDFREKAKELLENKKIDLEKHIVNYQNFKKEALSNSNYIRRLAKIQSRATNQMLFLQHLDKTKIAIKKFNLDIEVDEAKETIKFENKSQVSDIINLMQDSFYITIIGNQNGIDEER